MLLVRLRVIEYSHLNHPSSINRNGFAESGKMGIYSLPVWGQSVENGLEN
jgi:hypothetical protein